MVEEWKCQRCNRVLANHHESHGEEVDPKAGDLFLCAYCYCIAVYESDDNIRPLTEEELNDLPLEPLAEVMRAILLLTKFKSRNPGVFQNT